MRAVGAVKGKQTPQGPFNLQTKKQSKLKPQTALHHLFQNTHQPGFIEKAASNIRINNSRNTSDVSAVTKIDQIKDLFYKATHGKENSSQDFSSLYNNLKSNVKVRELYNTFKMLYCEHIIEQAVTTNNHQLLADELADQCGIMTMPTDYLITTLRKINNPDALRLARAVSSISKIEFSRHKLAPIEMLELCIAGEKALQNAAKKSKVVYMRADKLQACRSCVIDPHRNTFTILSKSHGELAASGSFKRVSDAVEVAINGDNAKAKRVAHVRNKEDEYIPSEELEYELKYGKILSWTRYKSKNRSYETKTLMIQDVYDHDLYTFTEFTPEESRKKISLSDMIQVLEQAGKTLLRLHKDGIAHRDVKAKNILYKKKSNGEVRAKLIDFGHCYVPDKSNYLRKRTKGYGTLRYTAPDLLENPSMKGNPLLMAQAEDAYALGECIYEVYLQQATPWGSLSYRALKKKKNAQENRETAIRLQKEEAALLAQEASHGSKSAEKELFRIMSRLLEPNPKERMQISEFMQALYDLKAKYAIV